jgi:hypothetical protein
MAEDERDQIPADQNFDPRELLYRRVAFEDLDQDGKVSVAAIRITDCSCNRSKYSQPMDALSQKYPRENGVGSFAVGVLPPELYCENSRKHCEVSVVHDPDYASSPPNPAHTEIRMNRRGEPWVRGREMSKTVQRKLRQIIVDNMDVVIAPMPVIRS